MFYLECQCKFRNVWNEIEGLHPFHTLADAIRSATFQQQQRRTQVRVVNDAGQVLYTVG
jgi:hypothetical protein